MALRLVHKVPEWQFLAPTFHLLSYWTKQFSGVGAVILKKHLIRRLLVTLLTLDAEKVFIFAVLRSFVFEYHIPISPGRRGGGGIVLSGGRQPIAGPDIRPPRLHHTPHPIAGQGVQLVAAHGDGLVQGLHCGPTRGPGVEAPGQLQIRAWTRAEAVPVPLAWATSPDLQLETKHHKTVQNDPLSADCLISNPSTNTAPLPALTRCQLRFLNVNITGDLWTPNGELLPLKIHYSDTKFNRILFNKSEHLSLVMI